MLAHLDALQQRDAERKARFEALRHIVSERISRVEAHVAERDGGRFDIALTVDGVEVGWVNLLDPDYPFGIHRRGDGTLCGCHCGFDVDLPQADPK